jgi:hypothetical protein
MSDVALLSAVVETMGLLALRSDDDDFHQHAGSASLASTVARGGVWPCGTQASHSSFMPGKSAMSAR